MNATASLWNATRSTRTGRASTNDLDNIYKALLAKTETAPPIVIGGPVGPLPAPLNEALKKFAEANGLEYDAKRGAVRFSSDLLFDLGQYTVKGEVLKQLADFSKIMNMNEAQAFDVLVVGHTDGVPVTRPETKLHTPTNWHLSVYRAVSVVQTLQGDGVSPTRLGAMGFGQERPRPGTSNAATQAAGKQREPARRGVPGSAPVAVRHDGHGPRDHLGR